MPPFIQSPGPLQRKNAWTKILRQITFFSQRSALMYDFWQHWPIEIEPLCYTHEEFETKKNQIGIVSEAIKEGILL